VDLTRRDFLVFSRGDGASHSARPFHPLVLSPPKDKALRAGFTTAPAPDLPYLSLTDASALIKSRRSRRSSSRGNSRPHRSLRRREWRVHHRHTRRGGCVAGARGGTGDRTRTLPRTAARHPVRRQGHPLHKGRQDDGEHAGAPGTSCRLRRDGCRRVERTRAACWSAR